MTVRQFKRHLIIDKAIPIVFITLTILLTSNKVIGQSKNCFYHSSDKTDSTKYFKFSTVGYPKEAKENRIEGTVILTFTVDSICSIKDRQVKQGLGYGCDEEALTLLTKIEGQLKKENKSKCFPDTVTLPINFTMGLNDNK